MNAGHLGVLLVAGALTLGACSSTVATEPTGVDTRTSTPLSAFPSGSPLSSPLDIANCRRVLHIAWGRGGAAMGTSYRTIVVSNHSGYQCGLLPRGYASLSFASHDPANPGFPSAPDQRHHGVAVIHPGGRVYFSVHWSNPLNYSPRFRSEHCNPVTPYIVGVEVTPGDIPHNLPFHGTVCSFGQAAPHVTPYRSTPRLR